MKQIADILEKQRASKGISKNQLALRSDMSRPTMLNVVQKGKVRNGYSVETLLKLADTLDLAISIAKK